MRIVNSQEFYKLPKGTLFAKYDPVIFNGLYVKCRNIYNHENKPVDYVFESLLENVYFENSSDYSTALIEAEEKGSSFKLDFDCSERNGLYEDDALFAIYEKEDIIKFIQKLSFCKSIFTF